MTDATSPLAGLGPVEWTTARVDVQLSVQRSHPAVRGLGLGLRHNPRRVQLLVTPALAKHIPIPAAEAFAAAQALAEALTAASPHGATPADLVMGFAETATGLGWLTARALAGKGVVDYIHSTRTPDGAPSARPGRLTFDEVHSHARSHEIQPHDPDFLSGRRHIVLVDDEITTGHMAVALARQLRVLNPEARITLACLIDARPLQDTVTAIAREADVPLALVSVSRLQVVLGPEAVEQAELVRAAFHPYPLPAESARAARSVVSIAAPRPRALARHGLGVGTSTADELVGLLVDRLRPHIVDLSCVWVLGMEEQIALPVLLAAALESRLGVPALVSSSTRSPAVVVNADGYPLRSVIRHGGAGDDARFVYNVPPSVQATIVVPDVPEPSDLGQLCARGRPLFDKLPGNVILLQWENCVGA